MTRGPGERDILNVALRRNGIRFTGAAPTYQELVDKMKRMREANAWQVGDPEPLFSPQKLNTSAVENSAHKPVGGV